MSSEPSPCREVEKKRRFLRFLGYTALGLLLSTTVVIFDILNGGPCGELITPLVDYALPVMEDPDLGKTAADLARSRGFDFESHEVTSEDGYIIELHRIFNASAPGKRPPLVMGLPLFLSSAASLFDYKNNTAAYIFADHGFDVWLTNARGNRFGRRHVTLDPEKDKLAFYDFTFLDIGEFDLAAQIDYVLEITGEKKVFFAGISQGAASLFALLSRRPSYNDRIHAMASYGGFRSICFAHNRAMKFIEFLTWPFTDILLKFEALALVGPYRSPLGQLCARTSSLCGFFANYALFNSHHYVNISRFGVYLEHMPAGTSLKNFVYFGQSRGRDCDGSVREFDYDHGLLTRLLLYFNLTTSKNMERYGTENPPLLDPSRIRVPIKMYYSDGDDLVPVQEAMRMAEDIGIPAEHMHRITDDRFSHVNYILNKRRNDFIIHTMNFFKGINTPWPIEIHSTENAENT